MELYFSIKCIFKYTPYEKKNVLLDCINKLYNTLDFCIQKNNYSIDFFNHHFNFINSNNSCPKLLFSHYETSFDCILFLESHYLYETLLNYIILILCHPNLLDDNLNITNIINELAFKFSHSEKFINIRKNTLIYTYFSDKSLLEENLLDNIYLLNLNSNYINDLYQKKNILIKEIDDLFAKYNRLKYNIHLEEEKYIRQYCNKN